MLNLGYKRSSVDSPEKVNLNCLDTTNVDTTLNKKISRAVCLEIVWSTLIGLLFRIRIIDNVSEGVFAIK